MDEAAMENAVSVTPSSGGALPFNLGQSLKKER